MINVILKSFESTETDRMMVERAFRNTKLGTCISINNDRQFLPALDAQEHIWLPGAPLREGSFFRTVDWNTLLPLDEEIIESMRHCESIFMRMIRKYAHKMGYAHSGDIPYDERKRQYLYQLRYWNDLLETKHIDLVLMYHIPHQCYDFVLYNLCKIKGIPTLHLDHLLMMDAMFAVEDWEDSVTDIRDTLQKLREEYADPQKPVPLSKNYEYYFDYYRSKKPAPWYRLPRSTYAEPSFLKKWWKKALKVAIRKPVQFFSAVLSPSFWARKLREHTIPRFYDRHVQVPDLSKPFIYLALHCQPEASTIPEAGAFMDQELIAELIAACLPEGISLYVKEHPTQGERYRSVEFYQSLLAIPSVTLIPKETDTYALIDSSLAVATATGTVGFESVMRQKPVLMFGHFFFQYGPGVYNIRTSEDCKCAIEEIMQQKEPRSVHDIRLFLKAIDECATPYPSKAPDAEEEKFSDEEKAEFVGAMLERKIRSVLERRGEAGTGA
ncbi:MAG: hypothetical protein PHX87_00590 [Candidatus Peribacteraceae bacterium]|nr:hypothetical protein [Candidatus Peribacteraceae bacterium]MDD5741905.1 hypothetical protein [Candidatus Peribacteraceae bacterium]